MPDNIQFEDTLPSEQAFSSGVRNVQPEIDLSVMPELKSFDKSQIIRILNALNMSLAYLRAKNVVDAQRGVLTAIEIITNDKPRSLRNYWEVSSPDTDYQHDTIINASRSSKLAKFAQFSNIAFEMKSRPIVARFKLINYIESIKNTL